MTTLFSNFRSIVKENVPLSSYSTMRVGGLASYAAFPKNGNELSALILEARENKIRYIIVGNASNIVFSDRGFDGLVIFTTAMRSIHWDGTCVTAECGASLTGLSAAATKKGLSGLEFAFGIPGTVGGAVYMNAGAYGSQISAVLTESTYLRGTEILERTTEEHLFGYRTSIYRSTNDIILSAKFMLTPKKSEEIAMQAEKNMASRKSKQPLEYPNAGSVFKRPEGAFPGALIEQAGLKGFRIGGAEISEKHANFIVNTGNATADDILRLTEFVQKEVFRRFGILLETEIIYIS
ncbi:MAG: UDP-N-acetylmuramate dehydrogenase [Ruminococcaceae bacterium]|nr:UDP-N-acetylmuramate dehydrogenase [Oscillospiraceae bacterium]